VTKLIPNWAAAITYGNYIYIRSDCYLNPNSKDATLRHESIHVGQWHTLGFWGLGFLVLYLFYSIKYGYDKNPLEVEAVEKSKL
jgi:hypothetical protein